MEIDLQDKRALVTGSTAGIGYAIAKQLYESGGSVVINGRTEENVSRAIENLSNIASSGQIFGIAADLKTAEGVNKIISEFPEVDILINNAAIYGPKDFIQITDEEWIDFFQVNVLSGIRLSRHYLPRMVEKKWGRILFISSESGIQIPVEMIHYGVTKTAMLAVSRGLAESVAGTGVTVNAILPGPTKSEGAVSFLKDLAQKEKKSMHEIEDEFFKTLRPTSLIKRFATPEEVANLVVYVASPLSSATTGAALRVDGGVVRSII
jgi:NAD(P)-dependent dehydrogenase (short-subunit alcohol dehydrogenase family)